MIQDMRQIGRGTLILMDWMEDVDGHLVKGFYGDVYVSADVDTVGFEAKGHNSANWIARVQGTTEAVTVMGCQVRAFRESSGDPTHNAYRVLT